MLPRPNDRGLITVGGSIQVGTDKKKNFDGLFELTCEDFEQCSWHESSLNMTTAINTDELDPPRGRNRNQGRSHHVAFWVPGDLDMCQLRT